MAVTCIYLSIFEYEYVYLIVYLWAGGGRFTGKIVFLAKLQFSSKLSARFL